MGAEAARIRRATPGDALVCARLLSIAAHGMAEAVYAGLVPGQTTEEVIAERRIRAEGRASSSRNWWVAEDASGAIAGGLNAYPLDGELRPVRDDHLPAERAGLLRPVVELEAEAPGTFFVNVLAVFPEYRHAGLARRLIALAEREAQGAGLRALSLTTFEQDTRLVGYYRRLGFAAVAARPLVPHARLEVAGNFILMLKPIER
jgi:ribosomal protein S18 acetylase RimI-like enzyme